MIRSPVIPHQSTLQDLIQNMSLRYDLIEENDGTLPLLVMEKSDYSSNQCVYRDDNFGVWLYQANCLEFMDKLIEKYPDGKFDMIFSTRLIFYPMVALVVMQVKWLKSIKEVGINHKVLN